MDGAAGTAPRRSRATVLRRTGPTAICAAALCLLALLAPTAARTAADHVATSHHGLTVAMAVAADQGLHGLRLEHPQMLGAPSVPGNVTALAAATASSSSIVSLATVDSPRTRGPPVDGCF
jgi:hypothetical protein